MLTDKRDGKKYKTVMIGGQRWMAENLNYKPRKGNSWCYDNDTSNCGKYGRLYDWATAMNIDSSYNSLIWDEGNVVRHQGICPSGWLLPSREEWDNLGRAAGGVRDSVETSRCCDEYVVVWDGAAALLKSTNGWNNYEGKSGNGTDDFGFSALPGGYRSAGNDPFGRVGGTILADGSFDGVGKSGDWWTATLYDGNTYYNKSMGHNHERVYEGDYNRENGLSVRCVQIEGVYMVTVSSNGTGAQGGGSYFKGDTVTVTAGTVPGKRLQKWTSASGGVTFADPNGATATFTMPANDVTVKANFEAIVVVSGGTLTDDRDGKKYKTVVIGGQRWMAENLNYPTDGARCYNDNVDSCEKYGRLYSWDAAMTACPSDWHLPSRGEWNILVTTVGDDRYAAKMLTAKSGWNNCPNNSDDYGFSALPGGSRDDAFIFLMAGNSGYWWTATEAENHGIRVYDWSLHCDHVGEFKNYKFSGLSVRCLRDG